MLALAKLTTFGQMPAYILTHNIQTQICIYIHIYMFSSGEHGADCRLEFKRPSCSLYGRELVGTKETTRTYGSPKQVVAKGETSISDVGCVLCKAQSPDSTPCLTENQDPLTDRESHTAESQVQGFVQQLGCCLGT